MRADPDKRAEARWIADEIARIARTGMVLPGSITERRTHCGRAGCHCMADPPEPHGPYYQFTRKLAARTVGRWLTGEQRDDYAPWVANSRRLRELLSRLEAIGLETLELDERRGRQR
jgi:hypothetical protein